MSTRFTAVRVLVVLMAVAGWAPGLGSQDPPAANPEAAIRAGLQSADPADWVEPLAQLEDLRVKAVEGWMATLLREILMPPRSDSQPDRTRFVLKHKVMRTPDLGEPLLLELLVESPGTFEREIGSALARSAREGQGRLQGLLELVLARAGQPGFAVLFPQVFEIVAPYDPPLAVRLAVEHVGREPAAGEKTVARALQTFLRLPTRPGSWGEWWTANQASLVPDLLERSERLLWIESTQLLRDDPVRLRDWLLVSLGEGTPAARLRLAFDEVKTLIEGLKGNGGLSPQKIELLKPIVERLVEITVSDNQPLGFRLRALRRLEEMDDFLSHPELGSTVLEDSLTEWIDGLSGEASPVQAQLGLEAVNAVGILGVDVGPQLDALLKKTLADGWKPEDDGLVLALLTSLREIGPRSGTIALMQTVFKHPRAQGRERYRVLSVQALNHENVQRFKAPAKKAISEFYASVLKDKEAGEPRRYAIIYLGNLGYEPAVDHLKDVVTQAGAVTPADRSAAVGAISEIGGIKAAKVFRQLYQTLPEGDLRQEVAAYAVALCSKDEDLELVEAYVRGTGGPMPWFEAFLMEDHIRTLLNPDNTTKIRSNPDVQERWNDLRIGQCKAMLARVDGLVDAGEQEQGYRQLAASALEVTRFVESLAPEQENRIDVEGFREFQEIGRSRAEILVALGKKEMATCLEMFSALAAGGSNGATVPKGSVPAIFNQNVQWLMGRLQAQAKIDGERQLLDGLRDLANQEAAPIPLDPRTVELLNALEKRNVDEPLKTDG